MKTRPTAVAGTFYPADPSVLGSTVDQLLHDSGEAAAPAQYPIKALIVPHAGYIYSGETAARGYKLLEPMRELIKHVVLLGPVHRVPVIGLALPTSEHFQTPLGKVAIDKSSLARLVDLPQVVFSDAAHELEHSLEVQLPFLQRVLDDFDLVPLAVGDASAEQVAEVIAQLWGGRDTLFVISSDLSHFHPYEEAKSKDRQTLTQILKGGQTIDHQQACGGTPVNGLSLAAQRYGLHAQLVDYKNSGDTAGDKNRVVGYASIAFGMTDDQAW